MAHHARANFIYGFAFHRRSVERKARAGFCARFFRPHYGGIVRVPGNGAGNYLGRVVEGSRPERSTDLGGTADDLGVAAAIPTKHRIFPPFGSAGLRAL